MKTFLLKTLYYLVITPIALILKVFGVRYMEKSAADSQESYWNKPVRNNNRKEHYKSQY